MPETDSLETELTDLIECWKGPSMLVELAELIERWAPKYGARFVYEFKPDEPT